MLIPAISGTISGHFPASLRLKPLPTTTRCALNQQIPAKSYSQKFSISDQELTSRGFVLHRSAETLNLDELNTVFVNVGFPRRKNEKIEIALNNTPSLLWIEDSRSRKPVAFARATGDDVFNAIIWDVVVDPSFQGFGLGKAVMERLIDGLLQKGIVNIALYAEPQVVGFYRPLGFAADPDGIKGMVYSRKNKK